MRIDIPTLSIVLLISSILLVIIFFIQYGINRRYQGVGWWLTGVSIITLGDIFLALLQIDPKLETLYIILNNICFFTGTILIYVGILHFLDRRENWRFIFILTTIFILTILYFTFVNDNNAARRLALSLSITFVSLLDVWILLVYRPPSIKKSANFTATIFFAQAVYHAFRSIDTYNHPQINTLVSSVPVQTAAFLVTMMTTILWTFGLILMINQRLIKEVSKGKEQFELIFNTNPDAVSITRLQDGYFVDVNESFTELTGFTQAEVTGKSIHDINIWVNLADRQVIVDQILKQGSCRNFETIFRRKDDSQFYISLSAKVFVWNGQDHIISVIRDITTLKQIETQKQTAIKALRDSEELYRSILHASPDNITITNLEGIVHTISPITLTMFGYDEEKEILGHSLTEFLVPTDVERANNNIGLMFSGVFTGPGEYTAVRADGSLIEIEANAEFIRDVDGVPTRIVFIIRDITERKRLKEELQHQATTDYLTGVTNRRHFIETAHYEISRAIRFKHPLSIALIDIDHFKSINDTYGHAAGDEALIVLARLCCDNIREVDIFARLGGDEFVLLLPDATCKQAYQVVERIRRSLSALSIDRDGQNIAITISSGIAGLEDEEDTLDVLLARADQVLYQVKESGKNRVATNQCAE